MPQWLCLIENRFNIDQLRWGRWKPGSRIVGSSTKEKFVAVANFQSSCHLLDTSTDTLIHMYCLGMLPVTWPTTAA